MDSRVLTAMEPYYAVDFFNPSAAYLPAKKVAKDYEEAKNRIAHCIGAKGNDLVITAGATEANNLAFTALGGTKAGQQGNRCLILATEHDSVANVAKNYGVQIITVDETGLIDLDDLRQKIDDTTEFISISLANNEIGTIQPLAEIAAFLREIRAERLKNGNKTPILLHSDASQAMNLLDINVARLGVDLLTLNSAKVYGPKGVGALYVAHTAKLNPLIYGGGQENGLRSGTENVAGVMGFAAAFEESKKHIPSNRKKYEKLQRILRENLPKKAVFHGNKHGLANFCAFSLPGIDAERMIYKLEEYEIYVSTGAACAASRGKASRTLRAIGLDEAEIRGSLRISMGEGNTEEDILRAAQIISKCAEEEYQRVARQ